MNAGQHYNTSRAVIKEAPPAERGATAEKM